MSGHDELQERADAMTYTSTLLVLTSSMTGAQTLVERLEGATEADAARLRRQYPWPYYLVIEQKHDGKDGPA